MRVLFSSTSGHGHIFPMLPLARAFRSAGHEVLWATGADACRIVSDAGLPSAPCGLSGAELGETRRALAARAALLEPADRAAFMFPTMFGESFTPPMVADLLPLAKRWQPDLLVHEHGELGSPVVGAVIGRPSVTHAFGGAVPEAFVAEAGARVAHIWAAHGLPLPSYAGCFTSTYLDICPRSVQTVPTSHIPIQQQLRPVADTGRAGPAPEYLDGNGRPLVYLTWGTAHDYTSRLVPLVRALSALPVRLLVAVGPAGDPAMFEGLPPHVRVERWVDQEQVLEHCAVVVSHAGSGTFLGALARGLPQLCLPQAADQFRNAAGGARAGAALALSPDAATPEAVVDAVRRLSADPAYAARAAEVADEIRGMPSQSDVVEALVRTARSTAADVSGHP
jgi:UDP:flavonoid glycosyltransferase YjiC (YdhE family)